MLRTPRRLHRRVRRSFRPLRFPPSLRRRRQNAMSLRRQRQRHPRRRRPIRLARPMWLEERPSCRKWRARWLSPARTSTLALCRNLPRFRSGARPCRRPAFKLGQGQSVLPARLQSRPRHRHGDLLGRRADQFADQRTWPRLHRPQFLDTRNYQWIGGPQGAVLGGRRRFRQRRRAEYLAAR